MEPNTNQAPAKRPDNRFWIAIAIALVLMYGFRWLNDSPASTPPAPPPSAEAVAYAKTIPAYNAALFDEMIASGRPSLLFIFASWCPYCKQQHPVLDAFLAKHGDALNVAIVSVDRDKEALAAYLLSKGDLPYTAYHIDKADYGAFKTSLEATGLTYEGAIPFTVFFDASGKKVAAFSGLAAAELFNSAFRDTVKPQ